MRKQKKRNLYKIAKFKDLYFESFVGLYNFKCYYKFAWLNHHPVGNEKGSGPK